MISSYANPPSSASDCFYLLFFLHFMFTVEFTNEIAKALDKSQATAGVFRDLSKAFDWVDHSVLLSK